MMIRYAYFRNKALTSAAVVALCVLSVANAQLGPNLVTNGGFETPRVDLGGRLFNYVTFYAGQTFGGWTVTRGTIDVVIVAGLSNAAREGTQFADLDGLGLGGIRQDITISTPGVYRLSFALTGNTYYDPYSTRTMRVQLSSGAIDVFDRTFTWRLADHPNHDPIYSPSWVWYEVDISVPTAGVYTLTFTSLAPGGVCGPVIDDVRLQLVQSPEGDVNGDGCVNDEDLLIVLFNFGEGCNN